MREGNTMIHNLERISIAEDLQYDENIVKGVSDGGFGFDLQWEPGFKYDIVDANLVPFDQNRDISKYSCQLTSCPGASRIIYTESHDNGVPRVPNAVKRQPFADELSMIGLGALFTSPGVPMMLQGQEFATRQDFSFDPFPEAIDYSMVGEFSGSTWTNQNSSFGLFELTKKLISLRSDPEMGTSGLKASNTEVKQYNDEQKVLVYHRYDTWGEPGHHTIVAVNLMQIPRTLTIGVPQDGEWEVRIDLNPGESSSSPLSSSSQGADGLDNSVTMELNGYSLVILSQNTPPTTPPPTTEAPTTQPPTQAPTTEAPTTEAPTTEAPATEAPTTEAPSTTVLVVVLHINNVDFDWYEASEDNAQTFVDAFKQFISELLGIPIDQIFIISVRRGSVEVEFEVRSSDPERKKTSMDEFLAQDNPTMDSLSEALPDEAFEDPALGATVDSSRSSTELENNSSGPNVGAIVGGVIGALVGVALIAVLVYFVVRKDIGKKSGAIELEEQESFVH